MRSELKLIVICHLSPVFHGRILLVRNVINGGSNS
jgi:hypothetical protein